VASLASHFKALMMFAFVFQVKIEGKQIDLNMSSEASFYVALILFLLLLLLTRVGRSFPEPGSSVKVLMFSFVKP